MLRCVIFTLAVWSAIMVLWSTLVFSQAPTIVSISPSQNELNVPTSTDISVTFDIDMDETTINDSTFVVNARSTGLHLGTITYDSLSKTATFDPVDDFDVGELVSVVVTTDIQSSEQTPLDSSNVWSFATVVDDGSGTFVPDSVYPVGEFCILGSSVFAADFDSDGDLDLATVNWGDDNVSVLFNNGDGTFAPDSSYPVGDGPESIFAADLDGDGDLDLVTANVYPGNVSVLLNNGHGTFAPRSDYPTGSSPYSVFAADLDGDGDIDIVAGGWYSYVSVLLNDGDATFASYVRYNTPDSPYSVVAADLDGDGDLDLATACPYDNNHDGVSVLFNNGNGTFGPYYRYEVGYIPYCVFAADLDADGDLDLACANRQSYAVSVLLNNGHGTFAPRSDYPTDYGSSSVFAADLDGDGDLDLATANGYASGGVSVVLNYGDGTFAPYSLHPVGGSGPVSVFPGDLDGDRDIDLATVNYYSHNVSVLLNENAFIRGDANGDGIQVTIPEPT